MVCGFLGTAAADRKGRALGTWGRTAAAPIAGRIQGTAAGNTAGSSTAVEAGRGSIPVEGGTPVAAGSCCGRDLGGAPAVGSSPP